MLKNIPIQTGYMNLLVFWCKSSNEIIFLQKKTVLLMVAGEWESGDLNKGMKYR
jgi:hypothetical protein